jgi:hypothetical protein
MLLFKKIKKEITLQKRDQAAETTVIPAIYGRYVLNVVAMGRSKDNENPELLNGSEKCAEKTSCFQSGPHTHN